MHPPQAAEFQPANIDIINPTRILPGISMIMLNHAQLSF